MLSVRVMNMTIDSIDIIGATIFILIWADSAHVADMEHVEHVEQLFNSNM